MNNIFLYLYPISEYTSIFLLKDDLLYDTMQIKRPLPILNECIDKRYRKKGYQVVFVLYPEKDIFGVIPENSDRIIYTDISFEKINGYDSYGRRKANFIPEYPSEEYILNQLGKVDNLVVGGYHSADCVKKIAEKAHEMGINTFVDLEMTDLFFVLYKQEYFKIEKYDIEKFKEYMINKYKRIGERAEDKFYSNYSSIIYKLQLKTDC